MLVRYMLVCYMLVRYMLVLPQRLFAGPASMQLLLAAISTVSPPGGPVVALDNNSDESAVMPTISPFHSAVVM